jgi:DNA-binding MarR family transcriptional regulator
VSTSPTLPIGQLLGRLLNSFRRELHRRAQEGGYADVREAHLQVFGAIDWRGSRLTDLAARANMTLPAMSELVDDLQRLGYLARLPDPSDGRAKLIRPTRRGRHLMADGLRAVREIEAEYSSVVGDERFAALVDMLEALVASAPSAWRISADVRPPRAPTREGSRTPD